jgi:hypothetical protein
MAAVITSLEISRLVQSLLDEGAGKNLEAIPFALGCSLGTSVSLMTNTIAMDHRARGGRGSSRSWHCTQVCTSGMASSRAGEIGSPQSPQVPY